MGIVFASDDFAGTAGQSLSSYNSAWVNHPLLSGLIVTIGNGYARPQNTTSAMYYYDVDPPSDDYRVSARFNSVTTDEQSVQIYARMSKTLNSGYRLGVNPVTRAVQLFKFVNGTPTQLWISGSSVISAGSGNVMALECDGDAIKVYRNGSLIHSTSDSSNPSGNAGLRTYSSSAPSASTGVHVGEFLAETLYDVDARRRSPLILTPW